MFPKVAVRLCSTEESIIFIIEKTFAWEEGRLLEVIQVINKR